MTDRDEDTYTFPDPLGSKATFTVVRYDRPPLDWLIAELEREAQEANDATRS